jgi:thioesterase domain-containing protein
VDFHPEILEPYRNAPSKMTDGIHPLSKMLGDVKFHQHRAIDARAADRPDPGPAGTPLGPATRRLAAALGYHEEAGCKPAVAPVKPSARVNGSAAPPATSVKARLGSPLVALQPDGGRLPLFCVHPPGGVVFPYLDLAARLRPDYPLYAFQGRGLDGTARPHDDLREMARDYVAAMREVQPQGPYHLGGWSLGGTVAFEMACQLAEAGQAVGLIALFDTGMSNVAPPDDPTDLERAHFIVGMAQVHGLELSLETILAMPPSEQVVYVARRLAETGRLPTGLLPYPIERVLELHQAHITAAARYQRRFVPGKVTLFRCSPAVDPLRGSKEEDYGWGRLAAEVEVVACPGRHRNMLREPHVAVVAERLKAFLDRARRRGGQVP